MQILITGSGKCWLNYSEEFGEKNLSISFSELIHNNKVINVKGGYVLLQ